MNTGQTARWGTRFLALAMVIVAIVVFSVMEKQLKRIGKAADRVDARGGGSRVERGARDEPRQPPTARLPVAGGQPGAEQETEDGALDSKRKTADDDPARSAREEALPEPGRLPAGAVW